MTGWDYLFVAGLLALLAAWGMVRAPRDPHDCDCPECLPPAADAERPFPGPAKAQRERFGDQDTQTDYQTYLEARRKIERARKAKRN